MTPPAAKSPRLHQLAPGLGSRPRPQGLGRLMPESRGRPGGYGCASPGPDSFAGSPGLIPSQASAPLVMFLHHRLRTPASTRLTAYHEETGSPQRVRSWSKCSTSYRVACMVARVLCQECQESFLYEGDPWSGEPVECPHCGVTGRIRTKRRPTGQIDYYLEPEPPAGGSAE